MFNKPKSSGWQRASKFNSERPFLPPEPPRYSSRVIQNHFDESQGFISQAQFLFEGESQHQDIFSRRPSQYRNLRGFPEERKERSMNLGLAQSSRVGIVNHDSPESSSSSTGSDDQEEMEANSRISSTSIPDGGSSEDEYKSPRAGQIGGEERISQIFRQASSCIQSHYPNTKMSQYRVAPPPPSKLAHLSSQTNRDYDSIANLSLKSVNQRGIAERAKNVPYIPPRTILKQPKQPSLTQILPSKKKKETLDDQPKLIEVQPLEEDIDPSLIRVSDVIPQRYQEVFNFRYFNKVQSECFNELYDSDSAMVISSPTASGKTALFEIAIISLLNSKDQGQANKKEKIIYIAPIKALCQERLYDWRQKFKTIKVIQVTGDTSDDLEWKEINESSLLLTTPEKWDSLTRRWYEMRSMLSSVKLLLIDEVHLLGSPDRGATLEAAVARMMAMSRKLDKPVRIIALSASIPNVGDIAKWIGGKAKIFGENYRPVRIERKVMGYKKAKNEFLFEKYLNYRVSQILRRYSEGKPSLIFCQTQKGTTAAAQQLKEVFPSELNNIFPPLNYNEQHELDEAAKKISDKSLAGLVKSRIGFHNASLQLTDRRIIEDLFIKQLVVILCTTSTLAQGVNLPCRLVVIKSTVCYKGAGLGYQDYSATQIQQMVGRAGRPQFDTKGMAVIMTDDSKVSKYEAIANNQEPVESHMSEKVIEHLNVEISLGTVTSMESALEWLRSTFLFVRLTSPAPILKETQRVSSQATEKRLKQMVEAIFRDLLKYELIIENKDKNLYKSTDLGKTMAKFYIEFDTMKVLHQNHRHNQFDPKKKKIPATPFHNGGAKFSPLLGQTIVNNSFESLLRTISSAKQNAKCKSKMEERKFLRELNDSIDIRYKVKGSGSVATSDKKTMVLIQADMSWVTIENWEIRREISDITKVAWRVLKCLEELFRITKNAEGLRNTILLNKCIKQHLWPDSPYLARQLPRIGEKLATQIARTAQLTSFQEIVNADPVKINAVCGKTGAFGFNLVNMASAIPQYQMRYELVGTKQGKQYGLSSNQKFGIRVIIELKSDKSGSLEHLNAKEKEQMNSGYSLIVSTYEGMLVWEKKMKGRNGVDQTIKDCNSDDAPFFIWLMNDKFVGLDSEVVVSEAHVCRELGISRCTHKMLREAKQTKISFDSSPLNVSQIVGSKQTALDEMLPTQVKQPQNSDELLDQLIQQMEFQSDSHKKREQNKKSKRTFHSEAAKSSQEAVNDQLKQILQEMEESQQAPTKKQRFEDFFDEAIIRRHTPATPSTNYSPIPTVKDFSRGQSPMNNLALYLNCDQREETKQRTVPEKHTPSRQPVHERNSRKIQQGEKQQSEQNTGTPSISHVSPYEHKREYEMKNILKFYYK